MNCNKFESIASDLACGHLMEAGLRAGALAHAEECAGCYARLSDERLLSRALRAAAVEDAGAAPVQLKAMLLAEFQQRAASPNVAPIRQRRFSRWAIAAAAAIFALVAIPAIGLLIQTDALTQTTKVDSASSSPAEAVNARASLPDAQSGLSKAPDASNDPKSSANKTTSLKETAKRRTASRVIAKANRKSTKSEATTEFIPLTYVTDRTAMESGTALLALGLPMNVDRAGETIKADVVVGDDGLARAIRIVY
jgi:hypothetical protein